MQLLLISNHILILYYTARSGLYPRLDCEVLLAHKNYQCSLQLLSFLFEVEATSYQIRISLAARLQLVKTICEGSYIPFLNL